MFTSDDGNDSYDATNNVTKTNNVTIVTLFVRDTRIM